MSDGLGDAVRTILADTLNLPPEFLDYTRQYAALNPISVAPINDEIGYDQITASVFPAATTPGTANTVIAGSEYPFDGNPIVVEFYSSSVGPPTGTVGLAIAVGLFEGATLLDFAQIETPATGSQLVIPFLLKRRFTPSKGLHTYSIKAWVTSGTGVVQAGAGETGTVTPAYLRLTKATS